MAYRDNYSCEHAIGPELELLYTYIPGVSTTIMAIPQMCWNTEAAGNTAEKGECIQEMVLMLFGQLTTEQQKELLTMCNDLFCDTQNFQ